MTVYMTRDRWKITPRELRSSVGSQKAVVTATGIDRVEIVPTTDERIDNTGYGRVA